LQDEVECVISLFSPLPHFRFPLTRDYSLYHSLILDQIHQSDYAHLRPKDDSLFSDDEGEAENGIGVKREPGLEEEERARRKQLEEEYGVDSNQATIVSTRTTHSSPLKTENSFAKFPLCVAGSVKIRFLVEIITTISTAVNATSKLDYNDDERSNSASESETNQTHFRFGSPQYFSSMIPESITVDNTRKSITIDYTLRTSYSTFASQYESFQFFRFSFFAKICCSN
jgi:hypothetical protein